MIPTEEELRAPLARLLRSLSKAGNEDGGGLFGDFICALGLLTLIGSIVLVVVGSGIDG